MQLKRITTTFQVLFLTYVLISVLLLSQKIYLDTKLFFMGLGTIYYIKYNLKIKENETKNIKFLVKYGTILAIIGCSVLMILDIVNKFYL